MGQLEEYAPQALRPSLWAKSMEWLDETDWDEPLIILSLLSLCVLVRVLWLPPVDIFWDAGAKWHFVRQWFYSNDFSHAHWSHHMARFGVNVPAFLAQLICGTNARVYYVAPLALFTLGTLFVYLTAKRLGGRSAGVLGALLMTFLPGMTKSASQLLPDGIAATAAVVAGYAFVRFHEEEGKKRLRWLLAVALACIWAYAIKEACVLFFPGVVLAVFLSKRSYKEAGVLVGALALYGALETLAFRLFTLYPHRLAVVEEEHGLYPPTTFFGLLKRFAALDPPLQMLFWLWVATLVYDASSSDRRRRLLQLLPLGYVFCLTFMVRHINPIIQWESFKPRYMAPATELFVVAVAVFGSDCLRRLRTMGEAPRLQAAYQFIARQAPLVVLVGCTLCGLVSYAAARPGLDTHALKELTRDASILNDAFRRNLVIIEHTRDGNPRGLNTVYAIYMRAAYLARSNIAKDGRLPNIQEAVRFLGKHRHTAYLLRDDSAYDAGDIERAVREGCAVEVGTTKVRIVLDTESLLPQHCHAPRGAVIPVLPPRRH